MKRSEIAEQPCPVGRAAAQLVDAWTFVILRELFLGNRRFEGLRLHSGMSPRSLSLRLARLVDEGILEKVPCRDTPAVHEYRLTEKGLELWPVLVTLRQWGERWGGPWRRGGVPMKLMHRGRGHALRAQMVCAECGEPVDARSSEVLSEPGALQQRAAFAAAVAAATSRRAR
ncbi:MAG: helix-turn-helix transcriptional regulator [Rubrivivax sp.]|nr:helix-turn-helix transcriptional regulator [Rubrivivax sp.]